MGMHTRVHHAANDTTTQQLTMLTPQATRSKLELTKIIWSVRTKSSTAIAVKITVPVKGSSDLNLFTLNHRYPIIAGANAVTIDFPPGVIPISGQTITALQVTAADAAGAADSVGGELTAFYNEF